MKNVKLATLALILLAGAAVISGCTSGYVGNEPGSFAYMNTKLTAVTDKSLEQVYAATLTAMDQIGLTVTTKQKDGLTATVKAMTVENKTVRVSINATSKTLTQFSIKVGTLGDQNQSQIIYDAIKKNLQ